MVSSGGAPEGLGVKQLLGLRGWQGGSQAAELNWEFGGKNTYES